MAGQTADQTGKTDGVHSAAVLFSVKTISWDEKFFFQSDSLHLCSDCSLIVCDNYEGCMVSELVMG